MGSGDAGTDVGRADLDAGPDTMASEITMPPANLDSAGTPDGSSDADAQDGDGTVDAGNPCGNGMPGPGKECDLGPANSATAYGKGQCTNECKNAPYCGDGIVNGLEVCDGGDAGSMALGACNPECTGYYTKKVVKPTAASYSTNLGGIPGADGICLMEFGVGWKAFLVGGNRQATATPFVGDQQSDWVIRKYTYYYNSHDQLVWITDNVSLLGVRQGQRVSLNAPAFDASGQYPWTGWATDWTTIADNPATFTGTCHGWTSSSANDWGDFSNPDLTLGASEFCGGTSFILCVQQ
jgi:hypothetical protein